MVNEQQLVVFLAKNVIQMNNKFAVRSEKLSIFLGECKQYIETNMLSLPGLEIATSTVAFATEFLPFANLRLNFRV